MSSTWKIVSESVFPNNFHWESEHNASSHLAPPIHLPSMSDVLRQGTKIPLRRHHAVAIPSTGEEHGIYDDDSFSFPNSLFTTGSGKKVIISSSGLVRAKTLLDTVDSNNQTPHCANKLSTIGQEREMQQESLELMQNRPINTPSVACSREMKNGFEENEAIKFHTAGGRSISISIDALQRARSLLGDPDVGDLFEGADAGNSVFLSPFKRQTDIASFSEKINYSSTPSPSVCPVTLGSNYKTKSFSFPLQSSRRRDLSNKFPCEGDGNDLITKFNAVGKGNDYSEKSTNAYGQKKPLCGRNQAPRSALNGSSLNGFSSNIGSTKPVANASNAINTDQTNKRKSVFGKRRLGLCVTISPFKKPRSSQISVPSAQDVGKSPQDTSQLPYGVSGRKREVSTRYPFQYPRMYINEYFSVPPLEKTVHIPKQVKQVTSVHAEKYVFNKRSRDNGMGAEAFVHLLAQHGASMHFATKEWVMNHYKWIVWKLACYERHNSASSAGKFLTVSNVLEELKYRYEREMNHGHRSTIKKILEGDALPSSMMILCISSIHSSHVPGSGTCFETQAGLQKAEAVKVELSDGWYSMNAILDVPLSKQQAAGRLLVGQKLRIWGAGLCGWNGPVSPLEVSSTVSLSLHINGTYRAHWAERLGFCKVAGPPLAFRCIKSNGGLVPQTLAGITRIYPVLYKERLSNDRSVVRSERMENKMMELYNQRCSVVVDGITLKYQKERLHIYHDSDSEGAKIYNMLETAEEPEFLMADMSPEQLNCFAAYKAKLDALTQSEMEKSVQKALEDAGLGHREVTPFMRIRVVGLTYKTRQDKPKEGIVTIWNPTQQCQELVEGEAYAISGLVPSSSDFGILHLQTKGSSTKWLRLSSNAREQFKSFFTSRKSIPLSSLSDIPLSNEFDIAAYVVHVGEVYTSSQLKKQWVFVTDGSIMNGFQSHKLINSLLAICFSSPLIDCDSFPPINSNLAGTTVGFCNLVKKEKDHSNHIWVADATENSAYYLNINSPNCSHLINAVSSVREWANNSSLIIEKLKRKVKCVIGDDCRA